MTQIHEARRPRPTNAPYRADTQSIDATHHRPRPRRLAVQTFLRWRRQISIPAYTPSKLQTETSPAARPFHAAAVPMRSPSRLRSARTKSPRLGRQPTQHLPESRDTSRHAKAAHWKNGVLVPHTAKALQ